MNDSSLSVLLMTLNGHSLSCNGQNLQARRDLIFLLERNPRIRLIFLLQRYTYYLIEGS